MDNNQAGNVAELQTEGTHEYLFDARLDAAIRISAPTEQLARAGLRTGLDAASANLGEILGQTIVCEVTMNDEPSLAEIDGEVPPPADGPASGASAHTGVQAALSTLLGVLLRADQQGGLWQALFNEGITDAYDPALDAALSVLGEDAVADIAHRYDLDRDALLERLRNPKS